MARDTNADRTVLVIGGAGYVGNVLVRRLLARGHSVRVLDALLFDHGSAISALFENPGFSFRRGDLRSEADRELALAGATDVVLLAALVGDPLCKNYPELARSVNAERDVLTVPVDAGALADAILRLLREPALRERSRSGGASWSSEISTGRPRWTGSQRFTGSLSN